MSDTWIDPSRLEGDALTQWYLRSSADVERQRQHAAARRYQAFFSGDAHSDPDPGFDREAPASSREIDPGFVAPPPMWSKDIDPGFTWAAAGPNRFRGVRAATNGPSADPRLPSASVGKGASPTHGALLSNTSYRSPVSTPPPASGPRRLSDMQTAPPSRRPPIDPSKTPVFQVGPDGKLHPIPGWRTTGPFDFGVWSHNIHWGGVTKDLGKIGAGVATFFGGAGLGGELLSALGPEAETAVAGGIAESPAAKAAAQAIHGHHPHPKYLGGAEDQERVRLVDELHRKFHSMLGKAHREAGLPPVGGKSGSTVKWAKHFELNPGSRDEAMEILRRVSREFDEMYGTNISSKLPKAPNPPQVGAPPAS